MMSIFLAAIPVLLQEVHYLGVGLAFVQEQRLLHLARETDLKGFS